LDGLRFRLIIKIDAWWPNLGLVAKGQWCNQTNWSATCKKIAWCV